MKIKSSGCFPKWIFCLRRKKIKKSPINDADETNQKITTDISIEVHDKENKVPEDMLVKNEELKINVPEVITVEPKEKITTDISIEVHDKENKVPEDMLVKNEELNINVPEVITVEPKVVQPPPLKYSDDNCYMNSIMQALGSCKRFLDDLKLLEYNSHKLKIFISLLEALNSSNAQIIFNNFMSQYGWNKDGQQDSYQLMANLINSIYNDLKEEEATKTRLNKRQLNKLWKEKILPGRLNMYTKATCACESSTKNISNDLSLHVPLVNTESDGIKYDFKVMLKAVFKEDPVEGGCEDCNMNKTLSMDIDGAPPNTLCLHIQANKYNPENGELMKPIYEMDFPFEFELKSKCYKLVSVVVHMGGISGGHYFTYRKFNGEWFLVDDDNISPINEPEVSADLSLKPYILFYELSE